MKSRRIRRITSQVSRLARLSPALTLAALVALQGTPIMQVAVHAQDEAAESNAQNLVTLAMNGGRIEAATAIISSQIGGTVSAFGKISGTQVTVLAENQPVETVLSMLANPNGWVWWREPNGDYGIADREYYERNILPKNVIQKVFRPNNIKASELDKAIKALITPNVGSSVADDRTNKLIVNDLPQALERIERFIREIDVQLIIRVFYIRHADVEEVAKKLEAYKSGPGTIEVDTKTHQIIVTDLLSNIKKMELLIDILDVGPEIVIYDVNNIGIEGKDLEDLQKIIDSIRTKDERLLFEVNNKQGVFILEDVPEVHERVEQILKSFDQPVKQVLLQGEILSTDFTRNFGFGLKNFAISENLLDAANQNALGPSFPFGGTGNTGGGTDPVDPVLNYTDIYNIFPNLFMSGNTVTANYLSSQVLLQYQATYEDKNTRVLLQPRLLVKNQQESRIFVGSEEPYLTTFFDDTNNNNNRSSVTQSTVTSGLTFEVTPSISNSYLIELELKIDNDEAKPQDLPNPNGDGTVRVVGRDRQQVETTLQIPSGQTRMIGGLIRNTETGANSGLPFLSSLPIVGPIFGSRTNNRRVTNLILFITPTIVEDVLPRPTTSDGRRGRLVTDYERVPGEMDLQQDMDDDTTGTQELDLAPPVDPDDLLSGDADEESQMLSRQEEARRRREQELIQGQNASNYTPGTGFGSATLNSGAASPSGPARIPPPSRPDGGGAGRPVAVEQPINTQQAPVVPVVPATTPGETQYR